MGDVLMNEKESQRSHILKQVKQKKISLVKAAQLLNLSDRQAKRIWKEYKQNGVKGLVSKKRGKPSNRSIPKEKQQKIIRIIAEEYTPCKPGFATEKLKKHHNIHVSPETVRKWMIEYQLWFPRKSKVRVHQQRPRRECAGELVHLDASDHLWFEDRGPKCNLHLIVDDATSAIKAGYFAEEETTVGYYRACEQYFKKDGLPLKIYCDKRGTFKVNQGKRGDTQFGRAMKELGVGMIYAHSPEAKGRIERAFGTLQDRLICEMRLQRISTIEEANKYLPSFIEDYNAKFGKEPNNPFNAHRQLDRDLPLKYILCFKSKRTVSKNLEVSYEGKIYQIQDEAQIHLRRVKLDVIKTLSGEIRFEHQGKEVKLKRFDQVYQERKVDEADAQEKVIKTNNKIGLSWRRRRDSIFLERNCSDKERREKSLRLKERIKVSREDNLELLKAREAA